MTWATVPLGSLAVIAMGQAPPSTETNADGVGIPFYRSGEFTKVRPTMRIWTTKPLRLATASDVLVCVVGANCGDVNLGADGAIGRSVSAISPDDRLDQRFLFHFLTSLTERLHSGSQGSAQGVITKTTLAAIPVPLPSLDEQHRIVDLLEDHLSRLDAADQTIRSIDRRTVALQDSWLGTHLTPRDGELRPLATVLADVRGGWSRSKTHLVASTDGLPYLKMNNITRRGRLDLSNVVHVAASDSDANKYGLEPGDVLFNSKNSGDLIGKTALADDRVNGALINENIMRLRFDENVVPEFAAVWFLGPKMRGLITGSASASTNVAAVYQRELVQFPMWVPSADRQRDLAARFESVREASERLQLDAVAIHKRGTHLRRSLLDAAFAGLLTGTNEDLSVAEEMIPA